MKQLLLIFSLCVAAAFARAAEANFGQAEPFKDGDTVCFVGDSITHGGTYHSMVALYYTTRFPDRQIRYYNCGIGGDSAAGIMSDEPYRLNIDILAHKPTDATLMLGMNDVRREFYQPGQSGPEVEKKREAALEVYRANMVKLIAALQKSGARLTFITPSIYDETTKFEKANPVVAYGRNGALDKCAAMVREWSQEYHTGLVLFHENTAAVNAREQAKDPAFTLIGADRVHPGPVGHFVMAYTFLRAQGLPRYVAKMLIDAHAAKPGEGENCAFENVKVSASEVSFDCKENALPLVVPDEAKAALKLVPFTDDLNQEILNVTGLNAGHYALKIDGAAVGEFSAEELGRGVNLAENASTPQYRQSSTVTKLNADRTRLGQRWRDLSAQLYTLSRSKVNVSDQAAMIKRLQGQIDAAKQNGKSAAGPENLLAYVQQPDKLAKEYEDLTAAMRKAAQPVKHHFALIRQ